MKQDSLFKDQHQEHGRTQRCRRGTRITSAACMQPGCAESPRFRHAGKATVAAVMGIQFLEVCPAIGRIFYGYDPGRIPDLLRIRGVSRLAILRISGAAAELGHLGAKADLLTVAREDREWILAQGRLLNAHGVVSGCESTLLSNAWHGACDLLSNSGVWKAVCGLVTYLADHESADEERVIEFLCWAKASYRPTSRSSTQARRDGCSAP
jgi:hypothetical protein